MSEAVLMRPIPAALQRLICRWGARPYVICPLIRRRHRLIVSDEKAILEPPPPSVLQRGPRCRRLRGAEGVKGIMITVQRHSAGSSLPR